VQIEERTGGGRKSGKGDVGERGGGESSVEGGRVVKEGCGGESGKCREERVEWGGGV